MDENKKEAMERFSFYIRFYGEMICKEHQPLGKVVGDVMRNRFMSNEEKGRSLMAIAYVVKNRHPSTYRSIPIINQLVKKIK